MQYAYGMRARGFSIGCQPKENFVECVEDTSNKYYNILLYSKKLSDEKVVEYELTYLGEIPND
jgi:hypothetical protein